MATRDSLTADPIHGRLDSGGPTDFLGEVAARIDRIPTGRFTNDWHPSWAPGSTSLSASVVDFPAELEKHAKADVHALALLGDTKQQALATATRMLSTAYGQSFDEATAERLCIVGASLECAEQIHCFVAAAAEAVCFDVLADSDGCDARVEQCCDVLPELRR